MSLFDACDIGTELDRVHRRLDRSHYEFAEFAGTAPCYALGLSASIARDRMRFLHLAMLKHGLNSDFDRWTRATMDQRMQLVGFQRLQARRPLYLRQRPVRIDLSDLFSIIHVDADDIEVLIAGLASAYV